MARRLVGGGGGGGRLGTLMMTASLLLKNKKNIVTPTASCILLRSFSAASTTTTSPSSTSSSLTGQRANEDPFHLFTHPSVRALLRSLTGKDVGTVFRPRKIGQKIRAPKYAFMTEEALEEAYAESDRRAEELLEMPPLLKARDPIKEDPPLSFDPQLQGLESSTIIFTDVTMGISDRDRIIVARDPDGSLRQASWEERDRMNAIYFPREGREFDTPSMFLDPESLQAVLDRGSESDNTYEFVLDRACLQFEPDDPLFISVCEKTYEAVDGRGAYDLLYSTRHYGPLVFYLARTRRMDGLLGHYLRAGRLQEGSTLVTLFHILFPASKSNQDKSWDSDLAKIRAYVLEEALSRDKLLLDLDAYEEGLKEKEDLVQELKESHGI